jgi:penicillin-binding protein 1C
MGAVLCVAAAGAVVKNELRRIGPPPLAAADDLSTVVLDRDGELLRAFTTSEGRWRLPVGRNEVDQRYLKLLFAFEDRRFYSHGGVDALAVIRAGLQFVRYGRLVSGASTLTMQTARLLDQKHEKTAAGKLRQMLRAVQLEQRLSKGEILDLYLRLAPFGGNLEGVRAASLAYFGKEPRRLSLGQAALLVALPQSPEARRPDLAGHSAKAARLRVLERALGAGLITSAQLQRAAAEPLPSSRVAFPLLAPHLGEAELAAFNQRKVHRLTIDRQLQVSLEVLGRRHAKALGERLSAAIVVIENETGKVLAHIGSAGYLDSDRFGAIDMVQAIRSPGSALKPVIYGMAFDAGLAHPETLIEDRPTRFGSYSPKNFDDDFHGTVTIRDALARSLNIPAVKVLDRLGPGRFLGVLAKAGIAPKLPEATEPSLAVALGGVGLTLRDLTAIFVATARGGKPVAIRHRQADDSAKETESVRPGEQPSLLSARAAHYLTQILKDAPPPPNARPGRIAFKTGTSYGYRDAWAIGFDGKHTIGVWVGRPDMASTPGLLGRTAAAPILFDAFQQVSTRRTPFPDAPRDAIKVSSGSELPPPLKRFDRDIGHAIGGHYIERPVAIAFPPDRSEVAMEQQSAILLKADGGVLPLTWLIDDAPIGVSRDRRQFFWQPGGGGFAKVSVVDARGRVDRVTVRLMAD